MTIAQNIIKYLFTGPLFSPFLNYLIELSTIFDLDLSSTDRRFRLNKSLYKCMKTLSNHNLTFWSFLSEKNQRQ